MNKCILGVDSRALLVYIVFMIEREQHNNSKEHMMSNTVTANDFVYDLDVELEAASSYFNDLLLEKALNGSSPELEERIAAQREELRSIEAEMRAENVMGGC